MATKDPDTAARYIPPRPTIKKLQLIAAGCKACHLWKRGTQTVFGEGRQTSTVMFVGEQPGNSEDLEGRPFVGPAGGLLDKALEEAGIDRSKVYGGCDEWRERADRRGAPRRAPVIDPP